jgi:NAD(P)-dependent dehydrogenase (short-subunit alcohol dehydrogenase family)
MATPEGKTVDGFETQFGTNHIGHFLLFQLLKPIILASATSKFPSRLISVSSVGHRSGEVRFEDNFQFNKDPYNPWQSYGQAKTANIYLASEVERRYGSQNLHGYSLHPGGIFTGLQVHVDSAIMDRWSLPEVQKVFRSTQQGAATTMYCALSADVADKGGKYFSDCWVQNEFQGATAAASNDDGYAPWIYDEEKERKLWKESLHLLGLTDDDSRTSSSL